MKIRNTLPQFGAVIFLIIALASCQEDFGTLGSDVIGGQDMNLILDASSTVVAYSRKMGAVQTNNLPLRQLGSYNDPTFGKSKVELISQLSLSTEEPSFGFDTALDSVVLYIPYISESTITEEVTSYTLDSVYGSDPVGLRIYESNYFLRDFDPEMGLQEHQKYYSNLKSTILAEPSNIGEFFYEEENFIPSNNGYVLISPDGNDEGDDPDETIVGPGLRVKLPVSFFEEKIIDMEGSTELMTNNNFKEYFRGIYFEVDDQNSDGNIFLFDISEAKISMYYSYKEKENDTDVLNGTLNLYFIGNTVSLISNDPLLGTIDNDVSSPNTLEGEETLYLRGGEGIVTIVNLFGNDEDGNGVPDELDQMRLEQWLISEANLIFYVDQNQVVGGEGEPDRIFMYDAVDLSILKDYAADQSTSSSTEPIDAVINHLGPLERGSDENGDFYRIRLTHHISDLVHEATENVPLALTVTNNVLLTVTGGFQKLENSIEIIDPNNTNPDDNEEDDFRFVPGSSIISHEGTVLFGNNTANEEKKLRLQIYYTKPN